jgi:hypothetical protein
MIFSVILEAMTDAALDHDEALLRGVLTGDAGAIQETIFERVPGLLQHIFVTASTEEQAKAVSVRLVETVQQRAPDLGDPRELHPWLFAVARWVLINSDLENTNGKAQEQPTTAWMDNGSQSNQDVLTADVCEVLNWLDPFDRGIIDLAFARNLPEPLLHRVLGIPCSERDQSALRQFFERANRMVGALVLLRQPNPQCPQLAELRSQYLTSTGISAGQRRKIAEHVDGCDRCRNHRQIMLGADDRLSALARVSRRAGIPVPDALIHTLVGRPSAQNTTGQRRGRERLRWSQRSVWPPQTRLPRRSPDGLWGSSRPVRFAWLPGWPAMLALLIVIGLISGSRFGLSVAGDAVRHGPMPSQSAPTTDRSTDVTRHASIPSQSTPTTGRSKRMSGSAGRLEIGISALDYGSSEVRRRIPIRVVGNGSVTFEVTGAPPWLVATPGHSSMQAGAHGTVDVELIRSGLRPGPFHTVLHIVARTGTGGGDITVSGQISKDLIGQLQVRTTQVDFGRRNSNGNIDLANVGDAPVGYTFVGVPSWLTVLNPSGQLPPKARRTIKVKIDRNHLPDGSFAAVIRVESHDGPGGREIHITGRKDSTGGTAHPIGILDIVTSDVDFDDTGTDRKAQGTITVRNTGDRAVGYRLANKPSWLTSTMPTGTVAAKSTADIPVTLDGRGLPDGPVDGSVTIEATSGRGGGIVALSGFVYTPTGHLVIITTSIDFGSASDDERDDIRAIEIENTGDAPIEFTVNDLPKWININNKTGTLGAGKRTSLIATLDRSSAPAGLIVRTFRIDAANDQGGGTVEVRKGSTDNGPTEPKITDAPPAPASSRTSSPPESS